MSHLTHRLRIFLFQRKVMLHSWDIQAFVFLIIPWSTKSVTSWWVIVHVTGYIYEDNLLHHNSLTHQTWSNDRYKQGEYFSETFWIIWMTGTKFCVFFNLATCFNYSITDYVKFPMFHFFERVNKREVKMVNTNY